MVETGLQSGFKSLKIVTARRSKHLQSCTLGKREIVIVIAPVNADGGAIHSDLIPKGKTVNSPHFFNTIDAPVYNYLFAKPCSNKPHLKLLMAIILRTQFNYYVLLLKTTFKLLK